MPKIVQMLPALGWGGAQIFCIQLCNELVKHEGYDVTLVSMYHHLPKHLPLSLLDKRVKFISLGKKRGLDVTMFFKVWRVLKKLKPDVVHTHLHTAYYCFYAYLQTKQTSFKKVHTFHNLVKKDSPWLGRQAFKYFFSNNIITPVSISKEVFKGAVEEYGAPIKVLINNGSLPVAPTPKFEEVKNVIEGFKNDSETKVLVNVARISKQKNQKLLLDCMKKLADKKVKAVALIIGDYDVDDKKLYEELIKNKPSNVHFLGKVSNVGDYLLIADAFVLTSIFEGLPISLLEALSAGATPVCTPVGGLVDIVTEDVGFLSEDLSTASFTKALNNFFESAPENLDSKNKHGKSLFEREFSIESCAARYMDVYKN